MSKGMHEDLFETLGWFLGLIFREHTIGDILRSTVIGISLFTGGYIDLLPIVFKTSGRGA